MKVFTYYYYSCKIRHLFKLNQRGILTRFNALAEKAHQTQQTAVQSAIREVEISLEVVKIRLNLGFDLRPREL